MHDICFACLLALHGAPYQHPHLVASQVEWLQGTLGFTRQQAARVVYANPGVLLSSIEGSLMPKIRWLAEALQMDQDMIFDMIRRRGGLGEGRDERCRGFGGGSAGVPRRLVGVGLDSFFGIAFWYIPDKREVLVLFPLFVLFCSSQHVFLPPPVCVPSVYNIPLNNIGFAASAGFRRSSRSAPRTTWPPSWSGSPTTPPTRSSGVCSSGSHPCSATTPTAISPRR